MSGTNGNGNGHPEKTVPNTAVKGFLKGFDPRRGHGLKGRSGRTRKEVREFLVREFMAQIPLLKAEVSKGKLSRKEYTDMCAKYGLGTTITETDTEGNDVPPFTFLFDSPADDGNG